MVKHNRTPAEQKLWDEVVKAVIQSCADINAPQGCAHLVREIADAVISERRESQQADK